MRIVMNEDEVKEACVNWLKAKLSGAYLLTLEEDTDEICFEMDSFDGLSAHVEAEVK